MADTAPITDPKALEQFLTIPKSQVPEVQTPLTGLIPQTQKAVESMTGPLTSDRFIEQEQRPGIPLQVAPASGEAWTISPWTRFQTERRQTLADQQKYLETVFGPGKVRKAEKTDDFIIQMPDPETGKPKDVVLNEREITLGDVGALAAHAPEIATSLLGMALAGPAGGVLSKVPMAGKVLAPIARSAVGRLFFGAAGQKVGETAQQVETELEQGQKPDVMAIAGQKEKEIPGQFALDTTAAGVFKAVSLARRGLKGGPGMFQGTEQTAGLPAAERLAGKYGQKTTYSAAEASGMPLLAFLEAYAAAKPQSRKIVEQFKRLQLDEQKALSEAISAKAGTDEEAGNKLLDYLGQNQKAKQDALDAVRATMTEQEQRGLMKQLGKISRVSTPFLPSESGATVRSEFQQAFQSVKSDVAQAYKKAYSVPGAMDPDVPTQPIADAIDSLRQAFPTAEGTAWLDTLKKELPAQERYRDIVQRRSDLWNKIQTAPADRSTKDYIFGQLSRAYTDTLDNAATQIKDVRFLTGITAANELYKKAELPFYQKGLADVLLKAGERGAPENIELLDRFSASTDLYRRMASVVGKDSPAMQEIKSSVIDGLLGKTGTHAINPQYVDAKKFVSELQNLAANPKTREMFEDIFGNRAKAIFNEAKTLQGIQGNLPKEEAERFLTGAGVPRAAKMRLKAVLDAQEQLDKVEAKRLLTRSVDEINPEQLVNQYADKLTQSELSALANDLKAHAPAVYQQLQDKTAEQILGKAGTYRTWTQDSLERVIHDPAWEPKYKILLGDKYADLLDFAKTMAPKQWARQAAQGTGMLVKGESIGELAKVFEPAKPGSHVKKANLIERLIGIVPGWLGWKYAAKGITSGAFREWASKDFPAETGDVVLRSLVTTPILSLVTTPILEDIAAEVGSPPAVRNMIMAVKGMIMAVKGAAGRNMAARPTENNQPSITDKQELERFLKER